jgi:NagD protein
MPTPDATHFLADGAIERLRDVRGFTLDLDGTLVLGDQRNQGLVPIPGAIALTRWFQERSIPFVLFTNGTSRAASQYAESLRNLGFPILDAQMLTPAVSAAELFVRRGYRRVLTLGGEGLAASLRDRGLEVIAPGDKPLAEAVLIGWYRDFNMEALESACHAVWNGATVYSASQALFFATASGRAIGTSRAIAAMIRDLTGCRVHLVGKPSLEALRCAARRLGLRMRDLAIVGDDPELEVPMAHRGGALAIAVQTGLGHAGSFSDVPKARRPHITVHGAEDLLALCQRVRHR